MSNKSQNPISLPETLRQKFAALERRLWRVETVAAACVGLIGLLGAFAVLLFLDRFFETPAALRATFLAVAVAVVVLAAGWWAARWIVSRRDWRALSLIVQRKFRRLGDRLLGIVELSSESNYDANYSPELYRAAIQQVADETAPFDFTEAVEARSATRLMFATAGLALLVLVPFLVVPALGKNVFHRLVAPLASVPRYTLVQIEVPEKIIVPHGENFALTGTVKFRSFWKPSRAVAQFGTQNPVTAKVNGNRISFQIPAQIQDGKLQVKIGDANRQVAVVPTYRPALKEISASIQLPEYLQAPGTNQAIHNGVLTLLEGSKFSLRGKISRELAAAETRIGETVESLKTEKDEFASAVFDSHPRETVATPTLQYTFSWRDNLGLSNAAPWKLSVRLQKDLAPSPNLPDLPSDVAMLDTDVLEIRALARDDYGVRDLGLNWEFEVDPLRPAGSATTEVKIQPNGRNKKELEKVFRWSPAIYRIPTDTTVELHAFAGDYFPERERANSRVHRIHVLGKEQHAELIRQRLESLLARVEEVARLEEKIMANTGNVSEDEKSTDKQKGERLGKINEDQQRNSKNLEQLASEGLKALQEALKNPVFTEQALQEWAKNLQQMQDLAQKEMKSASENLKSAQQNSDAESRKKDLAAAQQKQQEILDALEKMQGKVNKDLDDLQALTLAERLRRVGGTETEIKAEMQKIIPETIGLLPKELPEKFKKIGVALSDRQSDVHTESAQLQKEINRFFERTQKPNYGDVSKEIAEAKTVEEMERVGGLIKDNVGMEASRNLGEWSERFAKWADKLEPPKEESGSGSGSGSGQQSKDMTKVLVALLRVRANEITLREQTRLLDEERGDKENYAERAGALSETQGQLGKILGDLAKGNDEPSLEKPYEQTGAAMAEVENLLKKPQTDKTTLDAQVKAVDLLTDLVNLINEQAKRQNPKPQQGEGESQSTAEQMAFLMQMMSQPGKPGEAMTTSPSGGGNKSGGQTDRASENFEGDASGKSGENRRVEKASGAGNISLPAEFRDTLESYFKAVEQESN